MSTNLQQLFRLDLWANRLILAACRDLSPDQLRSSVDGTFGQLDRTLAHLVSAEDSYLSRLTGTERRFRWDEDTPVPGFEVLEASLERTGHALVEVAGTTLDDKVLEITRPTGSELVPAWVVLAQAIDHGREHRTHIATILTQLGIEPPGMDAWDFSGAEGVVTRI